MRISDWSSDVCSSDLTSKPSSPTGRATMRTLMGLRTATARPSCTVGSNCPGDTAIAQGRHVVGNLLGPIQRVAAYPPVLLEFDVPGQHHGYFTPLWPRHLKCDVSGTGVSRRVEPR